MSLIKLRPRILIVNAGLNGAAGNTAALLRRARAYLEPRADIREVLLSSPAVGYAHVRAELAQADALILGTGTHWDSWSHHLQRLLEEATPDEGSPLWLGKPAAVIVTMHSVGGKAVLSRLQGVLNTFGCLIPPMSGLVYSVVNQAALQVGGLGVNDVWCPEDVDIVCHNLFAALALEPAYKSWEMDRADYSARWIEA